MKSHGSGGSTALFAITNVKTGEVLLEATPSSSSSTQCTREVGTGRSCGLFSDAFDFITEIQQRSYDYFGQNMKKETQSRCTDADTPLGRNTPYVDPMMDCDGPSCSFMDSAEWDGCGDENGGADGGGTSGLGNAVSGDDGVPGPPRKKSKR